MNNSINEEPSIPQNINKFSIQDLYTFKEDLLQSLKKFRKEMSSKIKEEYSKCQELIINVNQKIESFDKNNLQFLTKLNFIEEKGLILDKIKSVEKDIRNTIMVQEIHLNTCQKDLNKSICKYDKAINDNLLVPTLVGPGCQFPNLKEYILSNKQEIYNFFSASKQREIEYKDFKNRINTFLSQMNIKTNIIRNNIEKSVNIKVLDFENRFCRELDNIKDKYDDLNSTIFENKRRYYQLENQISEIQEKFENIKKNNESGKNENSLMRLNSDISHNNNNNEEMNDDIKTINKKLIELSNIVTEKNLNSPDNSKKKGKRRNSVNRKSLNLNNSQKTNNINIIKEFSDILSNLISQITNDKKISFNLSNSNKKTNTNILNINNNNININDSNKKPCRQFKFDLIGNGTPIFKNREINSCLKEYIDGKITAENIKYDAKILHDTHNINLNFDLVTKDLKTTKRRFQIVNKEKINIQKKILQVAQENQINISGEKKIATKRDSISNTFDENTIKTPERSISKKNNSIKLSELMENIDSEKNLNSKEETTAKIDMMRQTSYINLNVTDDKKNNNNFDIIGNYCLTDSNSNDILQKKKEIFEKIKNEIDENDKNDIKNKTEDNKKDIIKNCKMDMIKDPKMDLIKDYKSKPKIILKNSDTLDRPTKRNNSPEENKQKFRSFSKNIKIPEKSRNNDNSSSNTFQKKLMNNIHATSSINTFIPEDKKLSKQNDSIKILNKKEQKILNNKKIIRVSNINNVNINNPNSKINRRMNSKSPKKFLKNLNSKKEEQPPRIKNLLTARNNQNAFYRSNENIKLTVNSDESNDLYLDKDIINNIRYVKDENLIDRPLIISSNDTFKVDKKKTNIENKIYELEFFTKKKLDELVKEIKNFIPIHFNAYLKDYTIVKYK